MQGMLQLHVDGINVIVHYERLTARRASKCFYCEGPRAQMERVRILNLTTENSTQLYRYTNLGRKIIEKAREALLLDRSFCDKPTCTDQHRNALFASIGAALAEQPQPA